MSNLREIGSEFYIDPGTGTTDLIGYLSETADRSGYDIRFLRCGRDALGFIADDMAGDGTVYMPALCCDSMVLPFAKRGHRVEYYRLKADLSAETDHLCGIIESSGDEAPVVLVMNYHGITDTEAVKRIVRDRYPRAIIMEDVTHQVLSPESFMSGDVPADYYIGSIRKWMGVPDGAFVIGRKGMKEISDSLESDFTRLRYQALAEKREYVASTDRPQDLKDHFRRLFSDAEDSLDDGVTPVPVSDTARGALRSIDLSGMRERRRENFSVLRECMSTDPLCGEMYEILNADAAVPDVPFMLPVIMHIEHIRESAHTAAGQSITRDRFENKLASRGVYAPVLWPIDARAAEICEVSRYFAQNMLAFYIDQRYTADDMRYVAEVFADELRTILG